MRELTVEEIKQLANRKGVRRIAVENFLMSMGTDPHIARANLSLDAKLYKWDRMTVQAISDGIQLASKEEVPHEPVTGLQTGMLGVPDKFHAQKRAFGAGQMEIGSYQKYQEAMKGGKELNIKGLKVYDAFHLFIPKGKDERDVECYDHSQGNWEILKHKKGQMWTLPTRLFNDPNFTLNHPGWEHWTAYDWWQYATAMGYMPQDFELLSRETEMTKDPYK